MVTVTLTAEEVEALAYVTLRAQPPRHIPTSSDPYGEKSYGRYEERTQTAENLLRRIGFDYDEFDPR